MSWIVILNDFDRKKNLPVFGLQKKLFGSFWDISTHIHTLSPKQFSNHNMCIFWARMCFMTCQKGVTVGTYHDCWYLPCRPKNPPISELNSREATEPKRRPMEHGLPREGQHRLCLLLFALLFGPNLHTELGLTKICVAQDCSSEVLN